MPSACTVRDAICDSNIPTSRYVPMAAICRTDDSRAAPSRRQVMNSAAGRPSQLSPDSQWFPGREAAPLRRRAASGHWRAGAGDRRAISAASAIAHAAAGAWTAGGREKRWRFVTTSIPTSRYAFSFLPRGGVARRQFPSSHGPFLRRPEPRRARRRFSAVPWCSSTTPKGRLKRHEA